MRPLVWLPLLLAACHALKRVVDLTPDNYDVLVGNGQDWMVEVYAPWCGHCKKLEPHYEAAAEQLKGNVNFGRIDGSKYRSLSMRFSIVGFPTIFHVHGATGEVRRAAVQHSTEALVTYATKGWRAAAFSPIPYWQSPNGPLKRAVFLGTKYGEKGPSGLLRVQCKHVEGLG